MSRHHEFRVTGRSTMACLAGLMLLGGLGSQWRTSADDVSSKRDLQAEVRSRLTDLDANQRTRRQQAEKELLDLGPAILGLLPPPELLPNQEVRAAVARIRVLLERRKAQESVQATLVAIPSKKLTLGEWLKQIESQSANPLDVSAIPAEVLQSHIAHAAQPTPFWKLLDETLKEKHLRYRLAADSSVLKLVPATDRNADAPWSVTAAGPFRVAVEWVRPRRVTGDDQTQRLRTELAVTPEPRLRALFLKLAARDFQATGPGGKIFPAADAAAQYDLPLGEGGRHVRWNLDFAAPGGLTDADLFPLKIEGRAAMQIAAGSEHIRFTDLVAGEGTARRRGGVTVTVQKIMVKKLENGTQSVSIKVLVVYDSGGPAFESHRTWIFHNQVYLDRHAGEPVALNGGFDTNLQANGSVGVTYRFEGLTGALQDYQFVYVAPTLIVDVPFEFRLNGVRPPIPE